MSYLGGDKNWVSFIGPEMFIVKEPLGCPAVFGEDLDIAIWKLGDSFYLDNFVVNGCFSKR
jgi:hypothetical protein